VVLAIHRSERADGLVAGLRALLADPISDPFASELVAVPTRGMERWLSQQLSSGLGARPGHGDGICAGVAFPSPAGLVADCLALSCGIAPDADPWRPERAVWPLLEVVAESLGESWLGALTAHLGCDRDPPDPDRLGRRLGAVRHIAELLYRYALLRPEMVIAWSQSTLNGDASPGLPVTAVWQAELWRRLRRRLAVPDPAERLTTACTRIAEDPGVLELPPRLALFGLTRLPAGQARVLAAIARHRDVHLFVLHPSAALWDAIATTLEGQGRTGQTLRRALDATGPLPHHDLLASWARDARELQLIIAPGAELDEHLAAPPGGARTLLGQLQSDIRGDRHPPGKPLPDRLDTRSTLDAGDRSVRVHACHGRARQVEVLREAILHALVEDPTLEPRDVIVMCPDIETFAPLIQATFGGGETAPDDEEAAIPSELRPIDLRVRLADRSLRQTNPVLGVVGALLELAAGRLTASQVLDLADREPVRRRFRFDDDDLTRLQAWTADAGIRWGLSPAHRGAFQLERVPDGTWSKGLDRVLLGVTMTEDSSRVYEGTLPLDDVDSGAIELAGRFAELIARLEEAVAALSATQRVDVWAGAIAAAADALTRTSGREGWQRAELARLLDELASEAGGAEVELAPAEVRSLLAERLEGRPTRANFRTGSLTVCTLHPMRSVPHRIVCLLGLDDGAFPRKGPRDGDDLTLEDPQIGERDPRSEDRQMLLDALMAATERLIVTYTGNDERTNSPQPPAVPVGELLDVLDATARTESGGDAREQVLVRHPLQPFDPRNFETGALAPGCAWGFDRVALDGARALRSPRTERARFLERPLEAVPAGLVELEDLIRFVQHPVRAFLRRRLVVTLGEVPDELSDGLTPELDPLARWKVGQRLLDERLAGVDGRTVALAEIARGSLPPGNLGLPVMRSIYPVVDALVAAAEQGGGGAQRLVQPGAGAPAPGPEDIAVRLPGGHTLTGSISGREGDVLVSTTYSRLAPKHRIISWVRLLALTASVPERPLVAVTIGRGRGHDAAVAVARIGPLGDSADERRELALHHLAALLDLYGRGMREPLPLPSATAAAYVEALVTGEDPRRAGAQQWESEGTYDKEDREPEHLLAFGAQLSFAQLLAEPAAEDEHGPGWDLTEPSRFGRLARRLWDPLLAGEEIATR
jgi:exodeoxyribonuclease V gamma subunit